MLPTQGFREVNVTQFESSLEDSLKKPRCLFSLEMDDGPWAGHTGHGVKAHIRSVGMGMGGH